MKRKPITQQTKTCPLCGKEGISVKVEVCDECFRLCMEESGYVDSPTPTVLIPS